MDGCAPATRAWIERSAARGMLSWSPAHAARRSEREPGGSRSSRAPTRRRNARICDRVRSSRDLVSSHPGCAGEETAASARMLSALSQAAEGGRVTELDDVENRITRVGVEATRGEESSADVARPERVPATAVRRAKALDLAERVDREAARTLEPELVGGERKGLQEREAVPRGAVADAVALLVAVRARSPDQLGAGGGLRRSRAPPPPTAAHPSMNSSPQPQAASRARPT